MGILKKPFNSSFSFIEQRLEKVIYKYRTVGSIDQKVMGSDYSFGEGIVGEDIDVLDPSEIEGRLK